MAKPFHKLYVKIDGVARFFDEKDDEVPIRTETFFRMYTVIMGASAPPSMLKESGNDADDKIGLKTEIISGSSGNLKKLLFRIAEDIKQ